MYSEPDYVQQWVGLNAYFHMCSSFVQTVHMKYSFVFVHILYMVYVIYAQGSPSKILYTFSI